MICPKCSTAVPDNAAFCPGCGTPLQQQPPQTPPPYYQPPYQPPVHVTNWLVPAILVTIFCCLPFGIPAIVYAAKANSLAASGDCEGAQRAASNAKTWHWVAFGVGLPIQILAFLIQVAAAA